MVQGCLILNNVKKKKGKFVNMIHVQNKSNVKINCFTCDLLQHFVRMFYLCFILTTVVTNYVKSYSLIIKKNHIGHFESLVLFAVVFCLQEIATKVKFVLHMYFVQDALVLSLFSLNRFMLHACSFICQVLL